MALLEWLAIGTAGLILYSCAKKNTNSDHEYDGIALNKESQSKQYRHKLSEQDRLRLVNEKRTQMPCLFCDSLFLPDFKALAFKAAKQVPRITSISVYGAIVYCQVISQTGLSNWEFNVDFNNWGHINGTFWTYSQNKDSSIPKHYGLILSGLIHEFLARRKVIVPDFSDIVDNNPSLETSHSLNTHYHKKRASRISHDNVHHITIPLNAKYCYGEHIYPIMSILKLAGFVNIKSVAIEDVDNQSGHYVYETDKISIDGVFDFKHQRTAPYDAQVVVYYHTKRRINMPVSAESLKRTSYIATGDYLKKLGFCEIYERPINDLIIGLITPDGAVENVFVDTGTETPLLKGESYYYDTKIIITYHTYK